MLLLLGMVVVCGNRGRGEGGGGEGKGRTDEIVQQKHFEVGLEAEIANFLIVNVVRTVNMSASQRAIADRDH